METKKLFVRSDNEVINNALTKSLPHFQHIYKAYTTAEVLKKAYLEIRGSIQHKSLVKTAIELDGKEEILSEKTQSIVDTVRLPEKSEEPAVITQKEEKTPKIKAPKEGGAKSKSDIIAELLQEGKTGAEITKHFTSQGLKCYSSEIYNAKKKLELA